ncbi:MAG: flagellar export protein FliJ [Oligoflexia bacterium]|nr:flagellar export protein FliJ [Oligoflexia bacterium]
MFKFSFEKLLEFRTQEENVARRDYQESLERLEIEKAKYQNLFKKQEEAQDEIFFLKNRNEGSAVNKLVELDEYIDGVEKKIKIQREIVINHTQIVEQKQEILHIAAKEKKILEKLKEKKYAEFKKAEKKKEAKKNDELVVTRYRSNP